jgi:hypothetical protein
MQRHFAAKPDRRLSLAAILAAAALSFPAAVQAESSAPGRWASNDNASLSVSKAGSRFFLDVVVAADGTFKGSWEEYACFNYTGPYGIVTAACQRSRKPSPASGRLDRTAGTGTISLDRMGKSPFRFKARKSGKGEPQLDIELPREWLKQGAPVLYEASLNPRAK